MAHWESLPFLGVGALLLGAAALVAVAQPRSPPHRYFAAFLALVGLNFLFNWIANAYGVQGDLKSSAWFRAGTLLNVFDAAALLYFVSIWPRRSHVARRASLAAAILVVVAAFTLVALADKSALVRPGLARAAFLGVFLAAYVGSLGIAVVSLRKARFDSTRRDAAALFAGLLVVVVPRVGLVETDLELFPGGAASWGAIATRVALASLMLLLALLPLRALEAPTRRIARPWLGVALAFLVAVFLTWVLAPLLPTYDDVLSTLYTTRWVLFLFLVGAAFSRRALLEVDLRRAAGVRTPTALLAAFAAFLFARATLPLGPTHAGADGAPLVLAALVGIVVGVGVGGAVPGWARALAQAERERVYRELLEAALEMDPSGARSRLAHARARLGITEERHAALAARLSAPEAGDGELPEGLRAIAPLASGATCRTWLARRGEASVVVKVLLPELALSPATRRRFLEEAQRLSRVRSAHVVDVLDVHEHPPAIVLRCAPGGNLANAVRKEGTWDEARLRRLAHDLLVGLGDLHAAGLVHGDVKPENVLLDADGSALLADLGIARESPAPDATRSDAASADGTGTLLYLAPEQIRGSSASVASDLHALGAVLVFAATGRHYLRAEGLADFDARRVIVEAPCDLAALPPSLRPLLAALLAKRVQERPADAAAALLLADTPR